MKNVVKHLDHLNMSVADLDESLSWYRRVFGFETVESGKNDGVRWTIVQSGDAMLCLYERPERSFESPYNEAKIHRMYHAGLRINDREAWERTIVAQGVEVQFGGARDWPHSTSWYVLDPTGHQIEVVLWKDDVIRFAA